MISLLAGQTLGVLSDVVSTSISSGWNGSHSVSPSPTGSTILDSSTNPSTRITRYTASASSGFHSQVSPRPFILSPLLNYIFRVNLKSPYLETCNDNNIISIPKSNKAAISIRNIINLIIYWTVHCFNWITNKLVKLAEYFKNLCIVCWYFSSLFRMFYFKYFYRIQITNMHCCNIYLGCVTRLLQRGTPTI